MVGRSFGRPPKKLIRPPIAASASVDSWAACTGAATMIASAPRPWLNCSTTCLRSSSKGLTTRSAPMVRACSARSANGSLTITTPAQRILAAKNTGKRFQQSCHCRVNRFADRNDIPLPHRVSWDAHILRETPIDGDPDSVIVGAQVIVAADALDAVPAAHIRRDENPLAQGESVQTAANFFDGADHLMPGDADDARRKHTVLAMDNAQIGGTDTGAQHFYQQFAGLNLWKLHLFHPQIIWSVKNRG